MKEALELVWQVWGMWWNMPWWLHVIFTIPFVGFLVFQFIRLFSGIIGDISWKKEEQEKVKKLEIPETGEEIIENILPAVLAAVVMQGLTKGVAVPNQLIQKKGKTPVVKVVLESPLVLTLTEDKLKEGFNRAKSERGLGYLSKLEVEYRGLQSLLDNRKTENTLLNLDRISKLTGDLYQKGLNFLLKALNISEQLGTSSKEALLVESEELRSELNKCTPGSTLYNMVTERLASNAKSLSTIKSFSEKLDEYYCQVGLCRDSIREIRLGIPDLLSNVPKEELDKIIFELRTRVELAQRVQAEYTRQGI